MLFVFVLTERELESYYQVNIPVSIIFVLPKNQMLNKVEDEM